MSKILSDQIRPAEVVRQLQDWPGEKLTYTLAPESIYTRHPIHQEMIRAVARQLGKEVVFENQPVETEVDQDQPAGHGAVELTSSSTTPPQVQKEKPSQGSKTRSSQRRIIYLSPQRILTVLFILIILGMIGGSAFAFYYLPRGTVTLFVAERVLERSLEVMADTSTETVQSDSRLIPGKEILIEVQETAQFSSTGKKTVGEFAVGTVEIRNFTDSAIVLPVNTILTWQNGTGEELTYTLTKEVLVPRATETAPEQTTRLLKAGTVEVEIKANDFGEKYNLALASSFLVADYKAKDVSAVSTTPIAGGTTEEVSIVTEQDQNTAQEQLRAKLFVSAQERLREKLPTGYEFKENTINNSTKFAQYDQEIDSEAAEFQLTLKVQSTVIAYLERDLQELLQQDIKASVPDGFELSQENLIIRVDSAEMVENKLRLKAHISALVVPVLAEEEIRGRLLGQSPSQAETYLQSIEKIDGYDIRLWPTLPEQLRRFPFLSERLEIIVEVNNGNSDD